MLLLIIAQFTTHERSLVTRYCGSPAAMHM